MHLQRIIMENYRQYLSLDLDLSQRNGDDLHIIVAENGVGKSNTINAIYWCLYGKEPNLDAESGVLPRLNQLCYCGDELPNNIVTVSVKLIVEIANNHTVEYCRTEDYFVTGKNKYTAPKSSQLVITEFTPTGSEVYTKSEQTITYVKEFIPEEIADYYLFDGEKLDTYFKKTSASTVQNSVSTISQIELMKTIDRKIGKMNSEFIKEAGKKSKSASTVLSNIEEKTKELNAANENYKNSNSEYNRALKEIETLSAVLEGTPDIAKLEHERTTCAARAKIEKDQIENKRKEKTDYLFDYYIRRVAAPYLNDLNTIIVEKKESGEIPVINDRTLIEDILQKSECSICGQKLSLEAQKHIKASLEKYKLPGKVSTELIELRPIITNILESLKSYPNKIQNNNNDISHSIANENTYENRIAEIEAIFLTYKTGDVKSNQEKRKSYEGLRDRMLINKDNYKKSCDSLEQEINKLKGEHDEILDREKVINEYRLYSKVCDDALKLLRKAENKILTDIREDIQARTTEIFRYLIWKEKTYDHVEIDENYNLSVFSQTNESVRGSLSSAEKELLALAFTMALHEVSGFSAPLIIDTPVSRISGDHRASFGKYLAERSHSKQIILLFTQDEYSKNIRDELEPHASNIFHYSLAENEKQVIVA